MTHLAKALIWLFVFVVPWENVVVIQGVGTARSYWLARAGLWLRCY